ncbi:MAG: hypothetical protein ACYDAD_15255 [Acidimicrobiales bacterium]
MRPRRSFGVAACAALVLAACGGRGNVLGTRASACYRALPPAMAAVHHQGHLVGVRLVSGGRAGHSLGPATTTPLPPGSSTTNPNPAPTAPRHVCLVAFKGSFPTAEFAPRPRARYAIVVVDARHLRVVRTVLRDRLPLRFHHQ